MQDADALQTLAEISIAIAGFGVVVHTIPELNEDGLVLVLHQLLHDDGQLVGSQVLRIAGLAGRNDAPTIWPGST